MLNTTDALNVKGSIMENCLLVSFDVINMFPDIDNKTGIEPVKTYYKINNDMPRKSLEFCTPFKILKTFS